MYGDTATRSRSRISKQPSHYPPLPFHFLRLGQFLSSLITTTVLAFFVHHLKVGHYYIPWTFLLLLTVSTLTLVAVITTSARYHLRTLSPKLNLYTNAFLSVLWILGLSFLTWNLSYTLGHHCSRAVWKNTAGIMVCRLYKALTAFTVTGLLTTLLATLLDFRTHRRTTTLGKYNPMHDEKHPSAYSISNPQPTPSYSQAPDPYEAVHGQREGSHDIARPYRVQRPIEAQQFGYQAPSEQTTYSGGGGAHWL